MDPVLLHHQDAIALPQEDAREFPEPIGVVRERTDLQLSLEPVAADDLADGDTVTRGLTLGHALAEEAGSLGTSRPPQYCDRSREYRLSVGMKISHPGG